MKKKIIILTASILRGNFHKKTIGKFYEFFNKYLIRAYEVYHIINIDEPKHLKNFFNYYETVKIFNDLIPNYVKKIFLKQKKAGFLGAYKNLMREVENKNLVSNENIYFWLEDDWEPIRNYDFTKLCTYFLKNNNSAISISSKSPLCSFRGGPLMSGSFFRNLFNCAQFMNNTCDPERQVNRWLQYKDFGNDLNREKYDNGKVNNKEIHLILIYLDKIVIDLNHLMTWSYKKYNKEIKFRYHLITIQDDYKKIKYSKINYPFRNNNYNLKPIKIEELIKLFNNNYIKYYHINPIIFHDENIGRKFTQKYGLKKWMTPCDEAGYISNEYYNTNTGNWRNYNIDQIRLSTNMTYNKNYFEGLSIILQVYPYLKKKYYDNKILLNLTYNSHTYGNYPNFETIGDLLKLNYNPSLKKKGIEYEELMDLPKIFKNICGDQISVKMEDVSNNYSYKKNFSLVSKIFNTIFKFDDDVLNEVNNFVKINKFESHNILGINYIYEKISGIQHIDDEQFMLIIEYELSQQKYHTIFVVSDRVEFIEKVKDKFKNEIKVVHYLKKNYPSNNQRYKDIAVTINKIKNTRGLYDIVKLEDELKMKSLVNRMVLKNDIINSLILSKCNLVLKTYSLLSAFSKIFNPNLRIYRVNGCTHGLWPESFITLYSDTNIRSQIIRKILRRCGHKEFKKSIKDKYLDLLL